MHWIITNREVKRRRINGKLVEVVTDRKRQPLPTFRVATFEPWQRGTDPNDDKVRNAVTVVPDEDVQNYNDLRNETDSTSLRSSKRMFLEVYNEMCNAPANRGDTLFFLHGFNYSWCDALRHLQRLHEIYVENPKSPIGRIMYFTWPSWGSLRKYKSDQRIAVESGQLLGRVFAKTVQFYRDFFEPKRDSSGNITAPPFCGHKIHIAAHSMGNQVLEEFLRSIIAFDFFRLSVFGQAIMLAADADWTALEQGQPLHQLPEFADRLHVYNHKSDDALRVSEWTKNAEKRLGRCGPKDLHKIPARSIVVDTSNLRGTPQAATSNDPFIRTAANVLERDDVSARERMFDHWGYLHRPEIVADICQVLLETSASRISNRDFREQRLYRLKPA